MITQLQTTGPEKPFNYVVFIKTHNDEKIRDILTRPTGKQEIMIAVGRLFAASEKFYNVKETDPVIINETAEMILSVFTSLSVMELSVAMKLHRSALIGREIQPYGFLSVQFFAQIFHEYVNYKRETMRLNSIFNRPKEVEVVVTEAEKRKILHDGIEARMVDIKNGLPVSKFNFANGIYDYLVNDLKVLIVSDSRKKQVYAEQKELLKIEYLTDQRYSNAKAINEALSGNKNASVVSASKNYLVYEFLKILVDEGLTFEAYLKLNT